MENTVYFRFPIIKKIFFNIFHPYRARLASKFARSAIMTLKNFKKLQKGYPKTNNSKLFSKMKLETSSQNL
jgi:hypothetical protein